MTTLTMRLVKGHFVVTGLDVEPMKFVQRPAIGAGRTIRGRLSPRSGQAASARRARDRQSDRVGERLGLVADK
jgi:hypothetical protein